MCTSKVFYKSLIFLLEISPDFNEAKGTGRGVSTGGGKAFRKFGGGSREGEKINYF